MILILKRSYKTKFSLTRARNFQMAIGKLEMGNALRALQLEEALSVFLHTRYSSLTLILIYSREGSSPNSPQMTSYNPPSLPQALCCEDKFPPSRDPRPAAPSAEAEAEFEAVALLSPNTDADDVAAALSNCDSAAGPLSLPKSLLNAAIRTAALSRLSDQLSFSSLLAASSNPSRDSSRARSLAGTSFLVSS
jgi:hypothetical protein